MPLDCYFQRQATTYGMIIKNPPVIELHGGQFQLKGGQLDCSYMNEGVSLSEIALRAVRDYVSDLMEDL